MNFEKFFRLISYTAVFCGFLSLWVSGTFGIAGTGLFIGVMIAAWFLEDRRWQISERIGTALIVLALPLYYLGWRSGFFTFSNPETMLPGILARLILSLTAIKLLQKKSDRDWIFLYLMSFFEVLLAAGLSISALYFGSFLLYLLVMVCAVIAFEIRKTSRGVAKKAGGDLNPNSDGVIGLSLPSVGRLPAVAIVLIVFICLLATPLFFLLPRVGGAGFGGNQNGVTTAGFSDTMTLGGIGLIQQSDEVVMRIRMKNAASQDDLYWRGAALDTFDNKSWSKSKPAAKEPYMRDDRDLIRLEYATDPDNISIQTIYLEPLDTPVLFALPRAVAIEGNFPFVYKDAYGGISFFRNFERVSYTVLSDRSLPDVKRLRADDQAYPYEMQNYLRLPENYDKRIFNLAFQAAEKSNNRYDKAKAIERYLQNNYGYTLELKAGGNEPLADFLFNVREGHCEYFAAAMAIMLRTQGIATRIVTGFHGGDYNDTADITVVRQRNAHAWVEVYFPKEKAWVPFDPTPFAGQTSGASTGIAGQIKKYLEALETFWIQYFVAFDNQEQQSLIRSVRKGVADYQVKIASWMTTAQEMLAEWWKEVRGDKGMETSLFAIGYGIACIAATIFGVLLFVWSYRRVVRSKVWSVLWNRFFKKRHASIVEFYDRMQKILSEKGLTREPYQTPLEFAFALDMPEAINITEKYNRVRFGEKHLSRDEADEIESWLERLAGD